MLGRIDGDDADQIGEIGKGYGSMHDPEALPAPAHCHYSSARAPPSSTRQISLLVRKQLRRVHSSESKPTDHHTSSTASPNCF